MISETNHMPRSIVLLIAICAFGIIASGSGWAFDTSETAASDKDPEFASAQALVDAGEYDVALSALAALDTRSPDNPDVLNLIGFSLRKTRRVEEAFEYYNRALALMPDHLGANEYLGELYLELKQTAKAKERLEILRRACGDCEEYRDLERKIEQSAATG